MNPLHGLSTFLASALVPLRVALRSPDRMRMLLRDLGWIDALETDLLSVEPLATLGPAITSLAGDIEALVRQLPREGEDPDAAREQLAKALLPLVQSTFEKLSELKAPKQISPTLPAKMRDATYWGKLAAALPEYLLLRQIELDLPVLTSLLRLLGVIVAREKADGAPSAPEHIDWERLGGLFTAPAAHIDELYHWSDGEPFEHALLLSRLLELGRALAFPTYRSELPPAVAARYKPEVADSIDAMAFPLFRGVKGGAFAELGLLLAPVPRETSGGTQAKGLALANISRGGIKTEVVLAEGWTLTFEGAMEASGSLSVAVYPDGIEALAFPPDASFGLRIAGAPETPWRVVGTPTSSRLEVLGATFTTEIGFKDAKPTLRLGADLLDPKGMTSGARVVIDPGEADGFLGKVLGAKPLVVEADLGFGWSTERGLRVAAGLGAEVSVPIHRSIGPVNLNRLDLEISANREQSGIRHPLWFSAGLAADAQLGPLYVSVEGVGLIAALTMIEDNRKLRTGELRLANDLGVQFAFKPPTALALKLQSDILTGGGFLDIDVDKGRYYGGLDLQTPLFGITGIALITVRPKGSVEDKGPKWSMLMSVDVAFKPALQLGMGIVLETVGGMFGANRRLDDGELRRAAREGRLDTLLTPKDIVKNADAILESWETVFPSQEGSFVIGPRLTLGWGAPSPLIRANIALLVSFPSPVIIALLGRVSCEVPEPPKEDEPALVSLKMDIVGVLNFGERTLAIEASLVDSRIAIFDVSGGMAFRLCWGGRPDFLLSIGGFHPEYDPPADLQALERLRFGASFGGKASGEGEASTEGGGNADADEDPTPKKSPISAELAFGGYFALTPNTVQFGAFAHFSATADLSIVKFGLLADFSFDALIQFKPFQMVASLHFEIAVSVNDEVIAGFLFDGTLRGPAPRWSFIGMVEAKFLGFKVSVDIDANFGKEYKNDDQKKVDVGALMWDELNSAAAWEAVADPDVILVDELPQKNDNALWLSPGQPLRVRQHVAPLGMELEQFGPNTVESAGPFGINVKGVGSNADAVQDRFSRGQVQKLKDAERLRLPAFELFAAGVELPTEWKAEDGIDLDPDAYEIVEGDVVERERLKDLLGGANEAATAESQIPATDSRPGLNAPAFSLFDPDTGVVRQASGDAREAAKRQRLLIIPSRAA